MTENGQGHRGLSDTEAERVRALFWEWWDAEVAAGRAPTKAAAGRALGTRGEAVTQWAGPEYDRTRWKNKPSRQTADAVGKFFNKPRNWWNDAPEEYAPVELDSVRILCAARDLALSEAVVLILQGVADGERMKDLSDNKKRAVLGAVHLLGYPLEQVVDAAQQVTEHDDDEPVTLYTKIERKLSGVPRKSGSYPSTAPSRPGRAGSNAE